MTEPNRPVPFTADCSSSDARRVARPTPPHLPTALVFGCALALLSGCGSTVYAIDANSAASKLAEAEELGAERYAPYEYYMASEHFRKAKSEAAEADYSDAAALADVAEDYADKAIDLAREAHRGAGR